MSIYSHTPTVSNAGTVVTSQMYLNLLSDNSCSGMNNFCTDGYSLYFPCLKDITRGTEVCFDFYVGDNGTQSEIDTRNIDAFSLVLSGVYGCEYSTYTYPVEIVSLQTQSNKLVYSDSFSKRGVFYLNVGYRDIDTMEKIEPDVSGKSGYFYDGEIVSLTANDTNDYFFVGWMDCDGVEGDEYSTEDRIVSIDKTYSVDIEKNTEIIALYRKRKVYRVRINFENRHSYFRVVYGDSDFMLSDKERDYVYILEGHHFVVTCFPTVFTAKNEDGEYEGYTYNFKEWKDGYKYQSREMVAGDDNEFFKVFRDEDTIGLEAVCEESRVKVSECLNMVNDVHPMVDEFYVNYPDENCPEDDEIFAYDFGCGDFWDFQKGVRQIFRGVEGYLYMPEGGYLESVDLDDVDGGVTVKFKVLSIGDSDISVIVNGQEQNLFLSDTGEFEEVYCHFLECGGSDIVVRVDSGEIYLDDFEVYKEEITNKGLMQLCIPPEDTLKMYPGALNVSGAISVGGKTYGISETTIGNINKLKSITI